MITFNLISIQLFNITEAIVERSVADSPLALNKTKNADIWEVLALPMNRKIDIY